MKDVRVDEHCVPDTMHTRRVRLEALVTARLALTAFARGGRRRPSPEGLCREAASRLGRERPRRADEQSMLISVKGDRVELPRVITGRGCKGMGGSHGARDGSEIGLTFGSFSMP